MRKEILSSVLILFLSFPAATAVFAETESSAESMAKLIYGARIIDKRIPLSVDVVNHQAIVGLSVNRTTSSFELDSKSAALSIAKVIMDSDPGITSALVQFKSAKSTEFNEVLVGGGEISSYNAGRVTREQLLNSLELNTMIMVDQPHTEDPKERPKPVSAKFSEPSTAARSLSGNSFSLLPTEADADTGDGITTEKPIPAVGTSGDWSPTEVIKKAKPRPVNPKDKYFSSGRVAFYYPPNWIRRRVSRNDWATPDEQDIAEFACRTRTGQPFLSLARFDGISLEERLANEAMVGYAFGLEVAPPESLQVGYRKLVPAKCVLSTGRDGLIYFKRVYFKDGFVLYALTLKCKISEGPPLEQDLMRVLSTLHSPRVDSPIKMKHGKDPGHDAMKGKSDKSPAIQRVPGQQPNAVPAKPPDEPDKLKMSPPKDTELRARPTA